MRRSKAVKLIGRKKKATTSCVRLILVVPPISNTYSAQAAKSVRGLAEPTRANRVFDTLGAALAQAARGLKRMEDNPAILRSIAGWDWILRSL